LFAQCFGGTGDDPAGYTSSAAEGSTGGAAARPPGGTITPPATEKGGDDQFAGDASLADQGGDEEWQQWPEESADEFNYGGTGYQQAEGDFDGAEAMAGDEGDGYAGSSAEADMDVETDDTMWGGEGHDVAAEGGWDSAEASWDGADASWDGGTDSWDGAAASWNSGHHAAEGHGTADNMETEAAEEAHHALTTAA